MQPSTRRAQDTCIQIHHQEFKRVHTTGNSTLKQDKNTNKRTKQNTTKKYSRMNSTEI
jgi:hypothetical protein